MAIPVIPETPNACSGEHADLKTCVDSLSPDPVYTGPKLKLNGHYPLAYAGGGTSGSGADSFSLRTGYTFDVESRLLFDTEVFITPQIYASTQVEGSKRVAGGVTFTGAFFHPVVQAGWGVQYGKNFTTQERELGGLLTFGAALLPIDPTVSLMAAYEVYDLSKVGNDIGQLGLRSGNTALMLYVGGNLAELF